MYSFYIPQDTPGKSTQINFKAPEKKKTAEIRKVNISFTKDVPPNLEKKKKKNFSHYEVKLH